MAEVSSLQGLPHREALMNDAFTSCILLSLLKRMELQHQFDSFNKEAWSGLVSRLQIESELTELITTSDKMLHKMD